MNFLGSNLRWLRKEKGLTQDRLAGKIGVKRSLVSAYEEGRTEPKLRTILTICHYFGISMDALVNTDLSKEQKTVADTSGQKLRILPIVVDRREEKELSTIVPVKASAGYAKGYGDIDYIDKLPRFDMPFPELAGDRSYRLFQISGDSMLPVPPGAYIICEYLQDWHRIKNEECYVLVTKDEGIVFKRIINNLQQEELVLKSDNPEYAPYTISAGQVIEVWKATGYTSFSLPETEYQQVDVHQMNDAIARLKNDVDQLKKKLSGNDL